MATIKSKEIKTARYLVSRNSWTQYKSAYATTMWSRYAAATGTWSTPRTIQSGSANSRDANLATDSRGNVFASWSQRTDSGTHASTSAIFKTTTARYNAAAGAWNAPSIVQDANRNGYYPKMDIDGSGRAVLLWNQNAGTTDSNGQPVKQLRADRVMIQQ